MTSGSREAYGPILRVVVRRNLPPAVGVDDVGILVVELPVVAPVRSAERRGRLEPGHVVHVDLLRIGLLDRRRLGRGRLSRAGARRSRDESGGRIVS